MCHKVGQRKLLSTSNPNGRENSRFSGKRALVVRRAMANILVTNSAANLETIDKMLECAHRHHKNIIALLSVLLQDLEGLGSPTMQVVHSPSASAANSTLCLPTVCGVSELLQPGCWLKLRLKLFAKRGKQDLVKPEVEYWTKNRKRSWRRSWPEAKTALGAELRKA